MKSVVLQIQQKLASRRSGSELKNIEGKSVGLFTRLVGVQDSALWPRASGISELGLVLKNPRVKQLVQGACSRKIIMATLTAAMPELRIRASAKGASAGASQLALLNFFSALA